MKTVSLTLAAQKTEQTAKAEAAQSESALKLGLQLAPGEGQTGVAIVSVDPDGLAASKCLSTGDSSLRFPASR